MEVELLEQLDLLERGLDERLGLVLPRELVQVLGSEPEFAPIRIGVPRLRAAFTTSAIFSGPPMFPG